MCSHHTRIAVAMSGGMDSAAAALILKRAGHEVAGFHMLLSEDFASSMERAEQAAEEIGVPLHTVDLRREFSAVIIEPFLNEYAAGRTPSPCARCNPLIKMTLLFQKARAMGFEKMATGHYARIRLIDGRPRLLTALDKSKDQSYFLFALTPDALGRTLFPLGERLKSEVREFLKREGVRAWESPESQELCFVPADDYRSFLRRHGVEAKPGPIVDLKGRVLGQHKGITEYTVGQRRGLGVCGPRPYYVLRIDPLTCQVVVGPREQTLSSGVRIEQVNLMISGPLSPGERFGVKIRSTARPVPCTVSRQGPETLELLFDRPQAAVAPGQAAALYSDEQVVGGGWIVEGLP